MNTVLVTGCAGFIGSHVVSWLLDREEVERIIGIDNLYGTDLLKLLKAHRLESLQKGKFHFVPLDIATPTTTLELDRINDHCFPPIDAVIHLAAMANPRISVERPESYVDINVRGTLNVLKFCERQGIKKFIFASTSSIYSGNEPPFQEDMNTDSVQSPYAATKRGAESLIRAYSHLYGIDVVVLRYFTVYGPAGRPDMALPKFISYAVEGIPIPVFGDHGKQARSFTYITDAVAATITALWRIGQPPLSKFEIINVGSEDTVTVMELIGKVADLVGRDARIKYKERHSADIPIISANCDKARKLLDWVARIGIDEGLERTLDWYMKHRIEVAPIYSAMWA